MSPTDHILRKTIGLRLSAAGIAAVMLSACASTPMLKHEVKTEQAVSQTRSEPPAQAPIANTNKPDSAATTVTTNAEKPIAKPAPVTQAATLDANPALENNVVISVPVAEKSSPPSNSNLIQRMRRGFTMPTRYNARIGTEYQRYAGQQKYIDELMAKASRFIYLAVTEAERRGLPTELALLPIIESAYDPAATSKSNAAGLWQFIPNTGRLYGLRQTSWFDARRDPLESTRAAYDYLAKLYGIFGDWELVLASYNAGPGTVSRAISANKSRGRGTDYWSLNLPPEAMAYVPRFLAVVSLFKDPISAGVVIPEIPNRPYFRTIAAQGSLDLDTISALSGVPLEELVTLNPGLLRQKLAPNGPFLLHVPNTLDIASEHLIVQQSAPASVRVANDDGFAEAVASVPPAQIIRANYIEANSRKYRIRRGDSWFSIARANHLSAKQLALANNDMLSTILEVGRTLLIPSPAAAAYQAHVFQSTPSTASNDSTSLQQSAPNDMGTEVIEAGNHEL